VTSRLPRDSNLPRLIRCLLIVAASAVMNSSAQALPTFDQIVVFGDSLSDNGNAGRASDGPVWVEHLATRFGFMLEPSRTGGSNFAVGGARLDPRPGTTSLRAQASAYLRGSRPMDVSFTSSMGEATICWRLWASLRPLRWWMPPSPP
jgi:hypothetical protein